MLSLVEHELKFYNLGSGLFCSGNIDLKKMINSEGLKLHHNYHNSVLFQ